MLLLFYICSFILLFFFFFSSRRRHTRWPRDWSSDVCSSDLQPAILVDPVDRRDQPHRPVRCCVEMLVDRVGWDVDRRASCRERVEITVVAGELKKNRKE